MIQEPQRIRDFRPNHFVPLVPVQPKSEIGPDFTEMIQGLRAEPSISLSDTEADSLSTSMNMAGDDESNENAVTDAINGSLSGIATLSFLETSIVVNMLTARNSGLDRIPGGEKKNCYFIIDNSKNREKCSNSKKCSFSDDCGVWNISSGLSPKSYYHVNSSGDHSLIFLKSGQYCIRKVTGKMLYVPMDPQPEKITSFWLHNIKDG